MKVEISSTYVEEQTDKREKQIVINFWLPRHSVINLKGKKPC